MARVHVVWTAGALRDLEAVHAHIAADSPRYADLVAGRIVAAFDRVADFPESGRAVPEARRADVREVIQGAYRLVYRLRGGAPRCWRSTTGPGASPTCGSRTEPAGAAWPLANEASE